MGGTHETTMPQPPRRPRKPTQAENSDDRRRLLMEATIDSLAEHGVDRTTVRAICQMAGVSRGLLTHYYPSKELLLADAMRHLLSTFTQESQLAPLSPAEGPTARMIRLSAELFAARLCTPRVRHALLALWHETRFNPAVREANRQLYVDYWAFVDDLFGQAAEEHGIAIDTRSAAIGLFALIDGLWLELCLEVSGITRKEAARQCRDYIEHRLRIA